MSATLRAALATVRFDYCIEHGDSVWSAHCQSAVAWLASELCRRYRAGSTP